MRDCPRGVFLEKRVSTFSNQTSGMRRGSVLLSILLLGFFLLIGQLYQTTVMYHIAALGRRVSLVPESARQLQMLDKEFRTTDGEFLRVMRKIHNQPTYIWSAMINPRHANPYNKTVVINTLDGTRNSNMKFKCCTSVWNTSKPQLHGDAKNISVFKLWGGNSELLVTQFTCSFVCSFEPLLVTLTTADCPYDPQDYVSVMRINQEENTLAVCIPPAYGTLDNRRLIEILEYYDLVGVDRVFMYVLNISSKLTLDLLSYYTERGMLEIVLYEIPGAIKASPNRGVDEKTAKLPQLWQDIQMPIVDCLERTSGYTYVGVFDLDELVVSKHGKGSLKDLMHILVNRYPDAGGFTFIPEMFPVDWNQSHSDSFIWHMKYRNRTQPYLHAGPKSVHMPTRISYRNVHWIYTRDDYQVKFVPVEDATMHHYRKCKEQDRCQPKLGTAVIDDSLTVLEQAWEHRVKDAQKELWD